MTKEELLMNTSTNSEKTILITNDDGINAAGIFHLYNALKAHYNVIVVAPEVEQSAKGLSVTVNHPLRVTKIKWNGSDGRVWTVSGTPADCIKMALSYLLETPPDLIVSGINKGSNAGRNVLYSGTVGGVIEGTFRGIPGIAFSSLEFVNTDYSWQERFIPPIVDHVLNHPLHEGTLLNVNFPLETGEEGALGLKLAIQGKGYWGENPTVREDPLGQQYLWLGAKPIEYQEDPSSDIALLQEGYITAVPVKVDQLTHFKLFETEKNRFETLSDEIMNKMQTT
jgi:5'-nucleotidase